MNISAAFASGRLTLYLSGELDHHAAAETMKVIDEVLERYMPRSCALDMSGVSFMDSSGIAVIINTGRKMRSLGGDISVENPMGQARRVLDASGIGRLVTMAESGGVR